MKWDTVIFYLAVHRKKLAGHIWVSYPISSNKIELECYVKCFLDSSNMISLANHSLIWCKTVFNLKYLGVACFAVLVIACWLKYLWTTHGRAVLNLQKYGARIFSSASLDFCKWLFVLLGIFTVTADNHAIS